VFLLAIAALPALAGAGPDGIELTVGRDPGGGIVLEWTGGQPPFEVFRSPGPVGVIDPANKIGETDARQWIDTPPPGAFFGYVITSRCAVAPPGVCDVTGSWVGTLDFEGSVRPVALRLHQRSSGRLLGYVLGGTHRRTIVDGVHANGSMSLELEWTTAEGVRQIHLGGSVSDESFTGTATGDIATQPVTFTRSGELLHERRFVFVDFDVSADELNELAVVLDSTGGFVAGGFSGSLGCRLWACDGGVTSFSESGGMLAVGLEADGGCSAGSGLTATFDADSDLYTGSYTFTSCAGSSSGSLIGARTTRTRSDHVAQVLEALGAIADQFEAGTPFAVPHPHFADDYFHNGKDLATLFAEWNAELGAYTDIEASFRRIKTISTVDEPDAFPPLTTMRGAVFDAMRAGRPHDGGSIATYLDSSTDALFNLTRNDLRVFEPIAGAWKIGGDRQPTLDLPWDYTISTDGRLETATAGDPIHVAPGVFAAHFSPNTGHAYGDHKTDGVGFLPADDSEMEELVGDGVGDDDGICEDGESCAYWGGTDGSGIRERIPVYRSRRDGAVTSVLFVNGPTGFYFDDPPQWRVKVRFANDVAYDLDHVGTFEPAFAAAVEAASGCNPNSWSLCGLADGTDLLEGLAPIVVSAGQALCSPQTIADEVPGYPGHYVGGGSWPRYPWVQLEFVVEALVDGVSFDICVYKLLAENREAELQAVLDTDMLNPASQRYRLGLDGPQPLWKWGAEGRACNTDVNRPLDFSRLYSHLGGWWERPEPGTTTDEIFAYAPIAKDVAIWDETNYDPLDPDALVLRQRARGAPNFAWQMPDGSTLHPFYPAGELLELTADTMLIKWRDMGYPTAVYQRAAYLLDVDGLKIKWGEFADSVAAASQPSLGPSEPCDDLEVLCYSHEQHDGY